MNKEILTVVDVVSNEKGVSKEIIFEAIEAALASATKKRNREDIEARVSVDRETGDYDTLRRWEVLDDEQELEFPAHQVALTDARKQQSDIEVGEFIEEPMKSVDFDRRAAQTAKQVIVQKVREAERQQVVERYADQVGNMVGGVVKRIERGNVIIDLGNNAEASISREKMIPKEIVRMGDRLRGLLEEVRGSDTRGPQLFLSRTTPDLLIELFKLEVPEINDGLIEIIAGARDPGLRAKISVKARDARVDPIGACVGMRGSRVQAVSNELAGERVDIILWSDNPAQFVINAMAPAEVASIMVDEDSHSMDVAVEEENLSQAIGRGGQNIRLASELTQWELNVMSTQQAEEKTEVESKELVEMFKENLIVDEEVASILVQEGFSTVEEIAYIPEKEMLDIEEFDDNLVQELRGRAKDIMLTRAITSEERMMDVEPAKDLLEMQGMNKSLAYKLASRGVVSMEDLAELSVDELQEIEPLDEEQAAKLIMTARIPWFERDDENGEEVANA